MSRMRLMQAGDAGATALECLYCGARAECRPPYAVVYCHCRSRAARPRAQRADAERQLAA
ncbi:MAG TPA: hypothetical protein VHG93_14515 [Longimicrobium sp.]|nr:hypothetical protein [Longimicrobium sp.]